MRYLLFSFLLLCCVSGMAQKESFDLATYSRPKGWLKNTTEDAVQFSKEDAAKGIYCIITLYKSTPSIGDSKKNFDAAWEAIVKETVTVSTDPEMQPVANEDDWEIQSGYAAFDHDGNKGIAMLVNATGFKKMVNVVILTNTDVFEKDITAFLESISVKKPVMTSEPATSNSEPAPSANNTMESNTGVAGIWGISSSDQSSFAINNGINGYTKRQYNFNANGTYTFCTKTFYLSDTPTKRDGTLSNTTEYRNAYLYDAVTSNIFLIDLPRAGKSSTT